MIDVTFLRKSFEKDIILDFGFIHTEHISDDALTNITLYPSLLGVICINCCKFPVQEWVYFSRHSRNNKKGDCYHV